MKERRFGHKTWPAGHVGGRAATLGGQPTQSWVLERPRVLGLMVVPSLTRIGGKSVRPAFGVAGRPSFLANRLGLGLLWFHVSLSFRSHEDLAESVE